MKKNEKLSQSLVVTNEITVVQELGRNQSSGLLRISTQKPDDVTGKKAEKSVRIDLRDDEVCVDNTSIED